jgi:hypothetical protein
MLVLPVLAVIDLCVSDLLFVSLREVDRNRQPIRTAGRVKAISVAPVPTGILNVVIKNECVNIINEVKISLPGQVA